jgi:hypothetical protein
VGEPTERQLTVGDFLPNTAYAPIVNFTIITPQNYDGSIVIASYACENCEPPDADKSQTLTVWFDRSKPPS